MIEIEDARLEATAADRTDLQAEPAQYAADAALNVEQLGLNELAGGQQRTHFLGAR